MADKDIRNYPKKFTKDFYVVAKSLNTNSFGLHQLILLSIDGEAYKTHASMYSAKNVGEIMKRTVFVNDDDNTIVRGYFAGTEMTELLSSIEESRAKEIIRELK